MTRRRRCTPSRPRRARWSCGLLSFDVLPVEIACDHIREGFKQIPELLLTLLQFRRQPVVLLGKWESKIPGISAPSAQHPFYGSKTLSVCFEPNMSGSRSTEIRLCAHAGMRNRNTLGLDDRTEPIGSMDDLTEEGGDREIRRAGRSQDARGNRAVSALKTSHHPLTLTCCNDRSGCLVKLKPQ